MPTDPFADLHYNMIPTGTNLLEYLKSVYRTRRCCQCVAFWLFGDGGDSLRNSDFAALESWPVMAVVARHGFVQATKTRPVKAVETPSLLPTWSLCYQPEVHMTCIER